MRLKRPKSALIEKSVMTGLYFLKKMPIKPVTKRAGTDLALSVLSITESYGIRKTFILPIICSLGLGPAVFPLA